jgi:hypothetical protein
VVIVNRKIIVVLAIFLVAISLTVGIFLPNLEKTNLFTYPLSVGAKTYIVTVETNWNAERAPSVTLLNSSEPSRYSIELHFLGRTVKDIGWENITYTITIPTDLLWRNISLIHKYSLVDPEGYTLINNGTHNSLKMTFEYEYHFSGIGYFEILGTEGAW